METSIMIEKFKDFFSEYYRSLLPEALINKFLIVNFVDLMKFDPELADWLLDNPEDAILAAEISILDVALEEKDNNKKIKIRVRNAGDEVKISAVRSKHIGKLVKIHGTVRQRSTVRPNMASVFFECPNCGNILCILQLSDKMQEPARCSCGRKSKFKIIRKDLVDIQGLVVEENIESVEGDKTERIKVILERDLTDPASKHKTRPGNKIVLTGIVKEIPILLQTGGQSTKLDLMIETNYIEALEESFEQIKISDEDKIKIFEAAKNNPLEQLAKAILPKIYGYEMIKKSLVLQCVGGCRRTPKDDAPLRGDIHMLLMGDPGAAKSQIMKRMSKVHPKARYVSAASSSGVGMTASVVKDEFMKGWALEAGAIVLANKGLLCIDEFDKTTDDDRNHLHEAMEQQTISINKANIQETLPAETSILAAANPKEGRFDDYGATAKQIGLPPTLINRFDLLFIIKDRPDEDRDTELATFVLNNFRNGNVVVDENILFNDLKFLQKYIAFCRQQVPEFSEFAMKEIIQHYVGMRKAASGNVEVKNIPISPRQLNCLARLAEASAKVRLSPKTTVEDAKLAIDIWTESMKQVGIDEVTGKFDIDKITTGVAGSDRDLANKIKSLLVELEDKVGADIFLEDIVTISKDRWNASEIRVEEVIDKLKRSGDIFEPRRGFVKRIH